MNFGDIVTLKLKGYSNADISELKTMADATPEVLELAKSGTPLNEINELIKLTDQPAPPEEPPATPPEDTGKTEPPTAPDTVNKIAELEKVINEQKTQIAEMQKAAQARNVDVPTQEEELNALIADMIRG